MGNELKPDAERAAWLADKIVALGDYAKEAADMLRRWPSPSSAPVGEPVAQYRCVKCGYKGPDQIQHQRPNGTGECGYIAARVVPQEPREAATMMRAAFNAWVQDCGCDTDGAWSAWQGAWKARGAQEVKAGEEAMDAAQKDGSDAN